MSKSSARKGRRTEGDGKRVRGKAGKQLIECFKKLIRQKTRDRG
jgi:hypothetical protein